MKKFSSIILAGLVCALPAFAQQEEAPNRLILQNSIGNVSGYVLDRIDNISFARVEGEAKAEIEIFSADTDMINLAVTKNEYCTSYKLSVVPAVVANSYNDLTLITYIDRDSSTPVFYDDYTNAELTGIELNPGSDYVLVTIGIDRYGVEDGVVRAPFSTPAAAIVGNPQITTEVVDQQERSFSIKFTPNEDVSEYYCVADEAGTMQQTYEMFGPMFGFSSFTDMIIAWGLTHTGEEVITWNGMNPNTEYDVFYVALDQNGNPAPYQYITTSTSSKGGEGEAWVDIELGEYIYNDWGDEMLPSQFLTFTPNDQSSCYRFGVYLADTYDQKTEEIKADLCSDPEQPMVYWFFYEPMTTDFQINPNTECVAIAAAKNVNGEWGQVNEFRFTTADKPEGDPTGAKAARTPANGNVKSRVLKMTNKATFNHTPGKCPVMGKPAKIQLR